MAQLPPLRPLQGLEAPPLLPLPLDTAAPPLPPHPRAVITYHAVARAGIDPRGRIGASGSLSPEAPAIPLVKQVMKPDGSGIAQYDRLCSMRCEYLFQNSTRLAKLI
jgi:hypothetical protein